MQLKRAYVIGIGIVILVGILILVAVALIPPQTNPAFDVAATFANAAGQGDDAIAMPLLTADLQQAVSERCAGGVPSGCVQSYPPPEWGKLINAIYRRSAPDGAAWDIEVISTYEKDKGGSGVCSYFHVVQDTDGQWRIDRWAGFIWCGDAASRNMATNPDTPNRMP